MKKLSIILSITGAMALGACNEGAGTTGTITSQESQQVADTSRAIYSDPGFMGADSAGTVLGEPTETEYKLEETGNSEVLEAGGNDDRGTR